MFSKIDSLLRGVRGILIDDLASLLHVKGGFVQVAERGLERGREGEGKTLL